MFYMFYKNFEDKIFEVREKPMKLSKIRALKNFQLYGNNILIIIYMHPDATAYNFIVI